MARFGIILCFAAVVGTGVLDPDEVKEVPHHNLNVEQTCFSVVHGKDNESDDEAGLLSLNSKGIYFYEKKEDTRFERYESGQLLLPLTRVRAEDRHWIGVCDFDKDGKEDLAYVARHTLYVHKNISNNTQPKFNEKPCLMFSLPHDKTAIYNAIVADKEHGIIFDANQDDSTDIMINNTTGCYFFNNQSNEDGIHFKTYKGPVIEFPRYNNEFGIEILAFDWDNDGLEDIMAGCNGGIFFARNNGDSFDQPEKVCSVKSNNYSQSDYDSYINNPEAKEFPYVPQYTTEDNIMLHKGSANGEVVPIAGTLFGFFAVYQNQILRLRLTGGNGEFLSRLKTASGSRDRVDFLVEDSEITYCTKAGFFGATFGGNGKYQQHFHGKVVDGGTNDRAYLLKVNYNSGPQDYAVGTSRKLQFFAK